MIPMNLLSLNLQAARRLSDLRSSLCSMASRQDTSSRDRQRLRTYAEHIDRIADLVLSATPQEVKARKAERDRLRNEREAQRHEIGSPTFDGNHSSPLLTVGGDMVGNRN
jgi:hypothetical protein